MYLAILYSSFQDDFSRFEKTFGNLQRPARIFRLHTPGGDAIFCVSHRKEPAEVSTLVLRQPPSLNENLLNQADDIPLLNRFDIFIE